MTTADGTIQGTTRIVDNGPPTQRFNIVIMGDGYQATHMNQYENDVQQFVDTMFGTPPFDELRRAINVYRVDVTSTDSGADDPMTCSGSGATARTYFDATFCGDGQNQRLLVVNDTTALNTAGAQVPQWHTVLVVINSTVYGGQEAPWGPSRSPQARRRSHFMSWAIRHSILPTSTSIIEDVLAGRPIGTTTRRVNPPR